jgi:membrane-associated protease RseP (regulator of RpoE activity)
LEGFQATTREEPEPFNLRQGLLLSVTVLTTLAAGTGLDPSFADLGLLEHLSLLAGRPWTLLAGFPFAAPLLFVLAVHEMGHFLNARRHGIRVTWPYFIPGPPFISLGTFGAFIRLKGPIPTRGALMEVGAGGPLWGFGASLAVALLGFGLGAAGYRSPTDLGANVNLPVAYWLLRGAFTGQWSWEMTLFDSPLHLAAWIGFFVQGLNLMPIGQLDGGHVLYAFAGRRHRQVSWAMALLFLAFAVFHPQWLIWAALLFFVLGLKHPPCQRDEVPLGRPQAIQGAVCVVLFVLTFLPVPMVWPG